MSQWHLGLYKEECLPWARGFDSYYGYLTGSELHYTKMQRSSRGSPGNATHRVHYPDFRTEKGPIVSKCVNASAPNDKDPTCYSAYMFTVEAQRMISAHAAEKTKQPLFMYIAMQDVHEPVIAPEHYVALQDTSIADLTRRTYGGMVSAIDDALKNITDTLKSEQMWGNTVLVVSNDNGGWNGYGGLNYPFRGHKTTLWEGGLKGIGWIISPLLKPGGRYRNLMHVTDWLPTLAEAAGVDISTLGSGFEHIDGVSHWKQLLGSNATVPRDEILFNIDGINGTGDAAVRVGDYKLLRATGFNPKNPAQSSMGFDLWCDICRNKSGCPFSPTIPCPVVNGSGYCVPFGGTFCANATTNTSAAKLEPSYPAVACSDDNKHACWLFDLRNDPSESDNLAASQPAKLKMMLDKLEEYNSGNVGCCSCQAKFDAAEMALPPKDGVWSTYHDMSDPTEQEAPLCDLLRKPPPPKIPVCE